MGSAGPRRRLQDSRGPASFSAATALLLGFQETGKRRRVLIRSADMFTEAEEQSGVEGKLPCFFLP